jgi:phage terminase large subunit GpA-like protein
MFDVRFQTEFDRVASIEEINMIESIINKALGNMATAKLARNATADFHDDYTEDYTAHGLINQPQQ